MPTKLITSGTGKIVSDSLISFSYSEDATPLEPTSSNGGTSQVSFSGVEETSNAGLVNTKLMIGNQTSIQDSDYGTVQFNVKKVSTNAAGIATVIGDSIQSRLNVIKTAAPFSGTLAGAIDYYCGLCGITGSSRVIDIALNGRSVNFIGWSGNVWEYLKDLCSVMSYNTTDRSPVEIYFTGTAVGFRPALTSTVNLSEYQSDVNQSVEIFEVAQTIDVYSYNTVAKTNAIVYDLEYYNPDRSNPQKSFLSSFSDSFEVNPGQSVTKVFKIDASLISIKQPDCVSTISPFPYDPSTSGNGQYVIAGSDGLPIQPAQWLGQGGSLVVAIGDNPNEIKITVTAPAVNGILKTNGELGFAPYRIGKETAGSGFDYPAIYIVGNGIFYNKVKSTFTTGADAGITTNPEAPEVDNIFITDNFTLANASLAAAQAICAPKISVNGSSASGFSFGSSIGKSFNLNANRFRLNSISFNESGVSWSAEEAVTFADFNLVNTGKTFSQFNSVITANMTFTDLSIIPLTTGV
jgi:hypothetical protein